MSEMISRVLCDRYRVEASLGRGGMAEVFKVWDNERATYLALKLLREDLAQDRVFLRRFRREAQTLAKLQHPNIVRSYGLEREGLLAFMLMDYVEGTSLRTEIFELDGQAMPAQRIRETMHPVCSALHYAHRSGMVHCDLKPGNVMIHQNGTVLVADFGIARMTDAATATMVGLGTPAYMAPELARGLDPTPQTDIYALGVVLFEMLTGGERPFTGEQTTVTGSTSEKVRWEQMNLNPPSLRRWNADISFELEEVVTTCLNKEPEKRYGSTLDLLNALEVAMPVSEVIEDIDTCIVGGSASAVTGAEVSPISVPEIQDQSEEVLHEPVAEQQRPKRKTGRLAVIGVIIAGMLLGGFVLIGQGRKGNGPLAMLATATPTPTPTATATFTPTYTPTFTNTPSVTPSNTPRPTETPTSTPRLTSTPRPTNTPRPTSTPELGIPNCTRWDKVQRDQVGKEICVYGIIRELVNAQSQTIYFQSSSNPTIQPEVRLLIINAWYPSLRMGQCVKGHGTLRENGPTSYLFINTDTLYTWKDLTDCDP